MLWRMEIEATVYAIARWQSEPVDLEAELGGSLPNRTDNRRFGKDEMVARVMSVALNPMVGAYSCVCGGARVLRQVSRQVRVRSRGQWEEEGEDMKTYKVLVWERPGARAASHVSKINLQTATAEGDCVFHLGTA